jgi:hypothetical protein
MRAARHACLAALYLIDVDLRGSLRGSLRAAEGTFGAAVGALRNVVARGLADDGGASALARSRELISGHSLGHELLSAAASDLTLITG